LIFSTFSIHGIFAGLSVKAWRISSLISLFVFSWLSFTRVIVIVAFFVVFSLFSFRNSIKRINWFTVNLSFDVSFF